MKIKILFEQWKRCRKYKKDYIFKWKPELKIDQVYFYFTLIPTIFVIPWWNVIPEQDDYIINISWLNMCVGIGKLYYKKEVLDRYGN